MPDTDYPSVLRGAAQRLRDLAAKAKSGPWKFDEHYGDVESTADLPRGSEWRVAWDMSDDDGAWIAAMSPAVAEPLAAWLSDTADDFEVERRSEPVTNCDEYAIQFARTILDGV